MQIGQNHLIFLTGKNLYANRGIIGLSPTLELTEGYDGEIEAQEFSSEECIELADYMIKKWSEFKAMYLFKKA